MNYVMPWQVDEMGANVRCEKNSLSLLSSKRTKAFSRTRADEAFALPSFSDAAPTFTSASPNRSGRGPKVEHCSDDVERLKQTMLQHESMFKEQVSSLGDKYGYSCLGLMILLLLKWNSIFLLSAYPSCGCT